MSILQPTGKRILLLKGLDGNEGFAHFLAEPLARRLRKLGHQVEVIEFPLEYTRHGILLTPRYAYRPELVHKILSPQGVMKRAEEFFRAIPGSDKLPTRQVFVLHNRPLNLVVSEKPGVDLELTDRDWKQLQPEKFDAVHWELEDKKVAKGPDAWKIAQTQLMSMHAFGEALEIPAIFKETTAERRKQFAQELEMRGQKLTTYELYKTDIENSTRHGLASDAVLDKIADLIHRRAMGALKEPK